MHFATRIWLLFVVVMSATNHGLAQSRITVLSDPSQAPTGPLSRQVKELVGNLGATPVARLDLNEGAATWEILYATNQVASGKRSGGVKYGNGLGPVAYGRSLVVLPRPGKTRSDPPRRTATEAASAKSLFDRLNEFVAASVDHDLLVFVHGFNVDFESAILRAAQVAQDMPFSGAMVCYAWPSQGGIQNYRADETIVQQSVVPLAELLTDLCQSVRPDTRINILVHSMGNRAVLGALNRLPPSIQDRKVFQHIIFAAPDVAAETFDSQVAAATRMAHQVTLYACSGDTALKASRQLHRDARRPWVRIERAGDSAKPLIVDGVQTIDVSRVDTSFMGHSTMAATRRC